MEALSDRPALRAAYAEEEESAGRSAANGNLIFASVAPRPSVYTSGECSSISSESRTESSASAGAVFASAAPPFPAAVTAANRVRIHCFCQSRASAYGIGSVNENTSKSRLGRSCSGHQTRKVQNRTRPKSHEVEPAVHTHSGKFALFARLGFGPSSKSGIELVR